MTNEDTNTLEDTNTAPEGQEAAEEANVDTPKADPKPARKRSNRSKPAPKEVTIRGRVATTVLPAGETVTVARTGNVDALIARGFVEVVEG